MKDVESILGEEKIIYIINDGDAVVNYIKSFDNVSYCDYSYQNDLDSLMGLFAYHKDNKYFFGEFVYFKENREQLKLIISDYPEHITIDNYDLTNDKFIDLLGIHNIYLKQLNSLVKKEKIDNISSYSLKKITLEEFIEIYPHRYINNRIRMYGKNKYKNVNMCNIISELIYRCPYCGSTNILEIAGAGIDKLINVNIYMLNDENTINHFYVCNICNLIIKGPNNIMDYI